MELAFAGVHQLCASLLNRLDQLPVPQRDAARIAFGLEVGGAPDRFLVGLAVLSLLSEVAEQHALVCIVDDAQWLDRVSAQVLGFVARRLWAERVALVFAVRDPSDVPELSGLPELAVRGLGNRDANAVLESVLPGRLDERVRDRIIAETHGNPLALLELPRGLTPAQLAGGFGLPGVMPLAGRIEQSFLRRVLVLPPETQRLLLTAAVEPVGDVAFVLVARRRAAGDRNGGGDTRRAGGPGRVRATGDISPSVGAVGHLSGQLPFRDLQEGHAALAQAIDPDSDPDRRAWHRAHAAEGADEAVAAELEHSSRARAMARGWCRGGGRVL